ncbi:MAG: hypothetical protein AAF611_21485 [Bacteroidota bacterium]
MKKKNLKSLKLNKNVVSILKRNDKHQVKGGGSIMLDCTTMFNSCDVCPPEETEYTCPSWWKGQFCVSDNI